MSLKFSSLTLLVMLFGICTLTSCIRDDAEPIGGVKQFTRLYVSFEEAPVVNPTTVYTNVGVIYPADSLDVFDFNLSYDSGAQGGGPLFFNPYSAVLFQAAANLNGASDTTVYNMNVGTTGVLSDAGFVSNRYYTYVKGLAYYASENMLFVVSANGTTNARIQVEQNPVGRQNYRGPLKRYPTQNLILWGAAYYQDQLFTSRLTTPIGITIFNDVVSTEVSAVDSTATLDSYNLTIAGAETNLNLRGLSYDPQKDILALAAYPTNAVVGQGRIYIFTEFSEQLTGAAHSITPTRIITGTATQLQQPVEVAIDTRVDGQFLYVADRSRRIFRFYITDDGDVEPEDALDTGDKTPVGLALDTRDNSSLDNTVITP